MSRCLAERSIDHVVLERGEVANTWRSERWDSLRLLTPNWQSRLPGYGYRGDDPDGYRTVPEVIRFIETYATAIAAPVETNTRVTSVARDGPGYRVRTDRGEWTCRSVVIASGACNLPDIPACADAVPRSIDCLTAQLYRNPGQLADGGVLVVGASASGTQIAHEIRKTGREVWLSIGEHIRAPRLYRGKDIQWWMDAAGVQNERYDAIDDIARARKVPSLQLAGTADRSTLDLNALGDIGVTLVGRLAGIANGKAQFAGSLRNMCALSDLKMGRLLETFDAWASASGIDGTVEPRHRLPPTRVADEPPLGLDLGNIKTIIWATGYRPDYSWLDLPVLDRKGMIRHDGGVADLPGLYVMGLHFMRRRKSSLIDGAGDDARELSDHLAAYLDNRPATSAPSSGRERRRQDVLA
ncbi:MAG: NAD(P)-binding domain-containing protein [Xanthobacteraceae bacterium]|nr:NAD(P)-binding domain-containing protein [Xanthobacteraceae bacterium]